MSALTGTEIAEIGQDATSVPIAKITTTRRMDSWSGRGFRFALALASLAAAIIVAAVFWFNKPDKPTPEMHVSGELQVTAIHDCPTIESSNGNLITGRFTHIAHDLLDVYIEGLSEPIRCTERHPFWSITRQTWIAAIALETGELLDIGTNTAQVVSIGLVSDYQRVYNIEVQGEHVYRVSTLGVLVHNSSQSDVRLDELRDGRLLLSDDRLERGAVIR